MLVMTMTGRFLALIGLVDLHDVEAHLVQDVEHVILEIRVRLVDLVDEQNDPDIGDESLADLAHLDVLFDVGDVALGIAETAVVETGEGVVLVKGLHQLHAGFHVQNDEGHAQSLGDGVSQHGFPRAGLPLEEEGHLQLHGNVYDLGQFRVEDVLGSAREALYFGSRIHSPTPFIREMIKRRKIYQVYSTIHPCEFNPLSPPLPALHFAPTK